MQWTDRIRRVKIFLVIAAVLIAVGSLLVSHFLTQDLKEQEHRKMEVWAEAMRTLYQEIVTTHQLTEDDIPTTAQARWAQAGSKVG